MYLYEIVIENILKYIGRRSRNIIHEGLRYCNTVSNPLQTVVSQLFMRYCLKALISFVILRQLAFCRSQRLVQGYMLPYCMQHLHFHWLVLEETVHVSGANLELTLYLALKFRPLGISCIKQSF